MIAIIVESAAGYPLKQVAQASCRVPDPDAIRLVKEALEVIEKFDTDREFVLRARARYCDLTTSHPDEFPRRSDGGAAIVMRHSNINA